MYKNTGDFLIKLFSIDDQFLWWAVMWYFWYYLKFSHFTQEFCLFVYQINPWCFLRCKTFYCQSCCCSTNEKAVLTSFFCIFACETWDTVQKMEALSCSHLKPAWPADLASWALEGYRVKRVNFPSRSFHLKWTYDWSWNIWMAFWVGKAWILNTYLIGKKFKCLWVAWEGMLKLRFDWYFVISINISHF